MTALRDTLELDEPDPGAEPVFGPWAQEHYLLAAILDGVRELQRITAQVNSDKPVDPVPPTPRPQVKHKRPPVAVAAMAFFQAIRDQHAQQQREEASE